MEPIDDLKDKFKNELLSLGFLKLDEDNYVGRIPKESTIKGYYIEVILDLNLYPFRSPKIILKSIKDQNNICRCIPSDWRHIDERAGNSPSESIFYICCLHNWSIKSEFTPSYVYDRIYKWLESNIYNEWDPEEDMRSWRIISQVSALKLYLTESFIHDAYNAAGNKMIYEMELTHNPYRFNNGGKAVYKNYGNKYKIDSISFLYEKGNINSQYHFFPLTEFIIKKVKIQLFHALNKKEQKSKCFLIKLNKFESNNFKSIYQLLDKIRTRDLITLLKKDQLINIPLIIVYVGDKGNLETIAILIDVKSFLNDSVGDIKLKIFQIETLPQREVPVNLNIAILGVGSLGGEIAKLLVEKGVNKLILSDRDLLSATNLGFHELQAYSLGNLKVHALTKRLFHIYNYDNNVKYEVDDKEAVSEADIVIVTVGSTNSFDELAFDKLKGLDKPIIWAWVSEYNVLQEIVITDQYTGCLNCYYILTETDKKLKKVREEVDNEISGLPSYFLDICGDPHVISKWERIVFLATQIVSILEYYSVEHKFPFDYINYFWKQDMITPINIKGFLNANDSCFCRRD